MFSIINKFPIKSIIEWVNILTQTRPSHNSRLTRKIHNFFLAFMCYLRIPFVVREYDYSFNISVVKFVCTYSKVWIQWWIYIFNATNFPISVVVVLTSDWFDCFFIVRVILPKTNKGVHCTYWRVWNSHWDFSSAQRFVWRHLTYCLLRIRFYSSISSWYGTYKMWIITCKYWAATNFIANVINNLQ